ncbi:hypothetical protein B0T10DRAFT_485042 [Thelonectria olida]|uniref:Uncharacterized protein n=1 Tax=Thelonectria olida TaxID=1576542 RepID=A0A9P8WA47_9HYPO|nr:hypothetical protein B0T10DRAFT_485042 [Thelonectria olida]
MIMRPHLACSVPWFLSASSYIPISSQASGRLKIVAREPTTLPNRSNISTLHSSPLKQTKTKKRLESTCEPNNNHVATVSSFFFRRHRREFLDPAAYISHCIGAAHIKHYGTERP